MGEFGEVKAEVYPYDARIVSGQIRRSRHWFVVDDSNEARIEEFREAVEYET